MQSFIIFVLLVVTSPIVLILAILGLLTKLLAIPFAKFSVPLYKIVPGHVDPREKRRLRVKAAHRKGTGLSKIRSVRKSEVFKWRIWFCYIGWIRNTLRETYKQHRPSNGSKKHRASIEHHTTES